MSSLVNNDLSLPLTSVATQEESCLTAPLCQYNCGKKTAFVIATMALGIILLSTGGHGNTPQKFVGLALLMAPLEIAALYTIAMCVTGAPRCIIDAIKCIFGSIYVLICCCVCDKDACKLLSPPISDSQFQSMEHNADMMRIANQNHERNQAAQNQRDKQWRETLDRNQQHNRSNYSHS